MSEIRATTISDTTGTGPVTLTGQYAPRGWVNFNGSGTIAARDSFNLSSLTDSGTGTFQINHSSGFADTNYMFTSATSTSSGGEGDINVRNESVTATTSMWPIRTGVPGTAGSTTLTNRDKQNIYCSFIGDLA